MAIRLAWKPLENGHNKSSPLVANFLRLFSNSTPWLILYALGKKGMTPSEISKSLGMTQKVVLPELVALKNNGVLISYSRSRRILYRLADTRILQALNLIHRISQRKIKQAAIIGSEKKTSQISRKRRQ